MVSGSRVEPGSRVCSKILGCYTGVYEQNEELRTERGGRGTVESSGKTAADVRTRAWPA